MSEFRTPMSSSNDLERARAAVQGIRNVAEIIRRSASVAIATELAGYADTIESSLAGRRAVSAVKAPTPPAALSLDEIDRLHRISVDRHDTAADLARDAARWAAEGKASDPVKFARLVESEILRRVGQAAVAAF